MIDRTKLRLKAEATSDMPSEVVLVLLDDLAAAWAEVARLNSGRDVERNMLWAALPKLCVGRYLEHSGRLSEVMAPIIRREQARADS